MPYNNRKFVDFCGEHPQQKENIQVFFADGHPFQGIKPQNGHFYCAAAPNFTGKIFGRPSPLGNRHNLCRDTAKRLSEFLEASPRPKNFLDETYENPTSGYGTHPLAVKDCI
jgi:hypothetical protein